MGLINSLPNTSKTNTDANDFQDVYDNDDRIVQEINGSLSNANISSTAQIAHSKLADAGTAGQLLVANASGVITATTVSGDATVGGTGALTIANDAVTQAKIADNAVGLDQMANSAVGTAELVDDAVTNAKLADDAVQKAQVADDAVGSAELDLFTGSIYSPSGGTSLIASGRGASLGAFTSVPPGTYLIAASMNINTTGNAGDVSLTAWIPTSAGTFTNGTTLSVSGTQYSYITTVMDPGPDTNTKVSYSLTAIATVTSTTSNLTFFGLDPSANSTTLSFNASILGVKS
jgi:hypothetical protein